MDKKTLNSKNSNKAKNKNDKKIIENTAMKEVAITYESNIVEDEAIQINFTDIEKDNILKEIKNINILNLTPMDGFNKLYELVKRAKKVAIKIAKDVSYHENQYIRS